MRFISTRNEQRFRGRRRRSCPARVLVEPAERVLDGVDEFEVSRDVPFCAGGIGQPIFQAPCSSERVALDSIRFPWAGLLNERIGLGCFGTSQE